MAIDLSKMSKLGFGLMRLPQKDGQIDLERVCNMVDRYMEAGFNYFDTAYVYHGGRSEVAAREAIVKRYPRESFMLATKLPIWELHELSDRDRIFNEQKERAGVDYFDFYLLHSVENGNIDAYEKLDCFNWGLQKKAAGEIKHLGFSFHGSPELLAEVLYKHPEMEFVQIQMNYADMKNPVVQSGRIHKILADQNIPMIIMEPVKGGTLANLIPEMQDIFKKVQPDKSMASWALRFVGSQPGVMTILSGMSDEAQMEDNLKTFTDFEPLSAEEKAAVEKVTELMTSAKLIGCTSCRYCTDGCPMKICIPDAFRAINTLRLYENDDFRPKAYYNGIASLGGRAKDCIACGQCESVCPQHLPIIELLKEAAEILDK